jgi:hypothetical protein
MSSIIKDTQEFARRVMLVMQLLAEQKQFCACCEHYTHLNQTFLRLRDKDRGMVKGNAILVCDKCKDKHPKVCDYDN